MSVLIDMGIAILTYSRLFFATPSVANQKFALLFPSSPGGEFC